MGPRKKSDLNLSRRRTRTVRVLNQIKKHLIPQNPSTKRKSFMTPMKSPSRCSKSPNKKRMKTSSARTLFKGCEEIKDDVLADSFKAITDDYCDDDLCKDHTNRIEINGASSDFNSALNDESTWINALTAQSSANTEKETKSIYESEMLRLVPEVMEILSKEQGGLDAVLCSFFRQVKNGHFPLDNIAFLLWTEVVKWFESSSTAGMRYSDKTKLFWKLGWRMFGGRFIYYMGGYKNFGDIVLNEASHGSHEPTSSEINFAVPDMKILKKHSPYFQVGERKPGIYSDIIETVSVSLENRSCCLTFDGKKIKQGLTDESGDVNLLGFGDEVTIGERQVKLENELEEGRVLCAVLKSIEQNDVVSINKLQSILKDTVKNHLLQDLKRISHSIFSTREIRERKDYCRTKLIERGGNTDWRKGKYVYAISAITAFIFDIDEFLHVATDVSEQISRYISSIHGGLFVLGDRVNLMESAMYAEIDSRRDEGKEETRVVKQQSKEWFDLRAKAKVTGSTLYAAIGCDGMNALKKHFDKVVCGLPEKEYSEEVKANMEHGSKNEINGVATIVGKVLPVLFPKLLFCEEGCVTLSTHNQSNFMVVSPDGSLRENNSVTSTQKAIEIKCPVRRVHTQFPCRYLLQCLSEIEALCVSSLLYVSWTENETVVFEVQRDLELFQRALDIAESIYGTEKPKKPIKLTEEQKSIKQEIKDKSKNVQVVGRFHSLKMGNDSTEYDKDTITVLQLVELFELINKVSKQFFELNRQRASEAVVFLVADLDRSWEKGRTRSSPVAWFPKGYSLTTNVMRSISEEVHTQCHNKGIHLPCQSFDGQWHKLVVRSLDDKPLTAFQLQKDVWKEVESLKKTVIIQELKSLNKEFEYKLTQPSTSSAKVCVLTNENRRLPYYRHIVKQNTEIKEPNPDTDTLNQTTLADVVPEVVRLTSDVSSSILSMEIVDGMDEMEALNVNVDDLKWAEELENLLSEDEPNLQSCIPNESNSANVDVKDPLTLSYDDALKLLAIFKSNEQCNKKNKWEAVTVKELLLSFTSQDRISRLLDVEVRLVVRYLKRTKNIKMTVKESSSKHSKIKELCHLLGLEQHDLPQRKVRTKKIKTLAELAADILCKKVSKQELNVLYAEYIWPERYRKWKENSAVRHDPTLDGMDYQWFYIPEFSIARQQHEVRCIDSTHLLTRTRRICCKGGLDYQSNEAWVQVAKSRKTLLTPAMVDDITDPMSVSMATTHFSSHVENTMRCMGYKDSADLCYDIRQWWESEDKPAIPASQRVQMRLGIRERLLKYLDFGRFPPATMYVAGWPSQLYEALLANIDAKALLYSLCHSERYNVRAFSSMIGETFFAELTLNDKRGQGTVTCKEFGQFIGNAVEQIQARLDPERTFAYRTCRTTVYNLTDDAEIIEEGHSETCRICNDGSKELLPNNICPKNHYFDTYQRGRIAGKKKEATVAIQRNALQKGSLGVRWEKARRNDAKMLPTKRMGIQDN